MYFLFDFNLKNNKKIKKKIKKFKMFKNGAKNLDK